MESEEKLCVKVLQTLQQMLLKKSKYGDRVSVTEVTGPERVLTRQDLAHPSLILPFQGNQLRKMLLQNYLQNRKSGARGELADPAGSGQCHGPTLPSPLPCTAGSCFKPLSLTRTSPQGLDQDWSAIAATQCRLDKEGATKLVCDLITSTKNEKIFQESIGLAIRLLDGGNTEIQVQGSGQKSSSSEGAPCSGGAVALGEDHG